MQNKTTSKASDTLQRELLARVVQRVHIWIIMRRFLSSFVICALCGAATACGAQITAPRTKPPLPTEASTQRTSTERPQPKLIAPPPAYGNKIVVVPTVSENETAS